MAVRMGVAVSVIVIVIVTVGGRWNHPETLYYNITGVH